MDVLQTRISTADPVFTENREHMESQVRQLKDRLGQVAQGGGPKTVEKHRSRGKLFVRDRIEKLIDPDTPFLELSPMAAYGMYGRDAEDYRRKFPDGRIATHAIPPPAGPDDEVVKLLPPLVVDAETVGE